MKDLIKRNYESTVKRGKINLLTSQDEFYHKASEELFEIRCEMKGNEMSKSMAIEITDLMLVCQNWLTHNGYDVEQLASEKITFNENRND